MKGNLFRDVIAICLVIILMTFLGGGALADDGVSTNKFNVAIVLDSSGSMAGTDPNGYRFEAISQFVNLLTEKGNNVCAVVFSGDIAASQSVQSMNNQASKNETIDLVRFVKPEGWTNIGKALELAVDMLEDGDPDLPSVILFLSDGNTELSSGDATNISLEQKANAIQECREKGVAIYSVCLNANHTADVSEMKQMADATAGIFEEVNTADDLPRVFNTFYSVIYGTSSITLVDDAFPTDGVLETKFEVPGIGVEEVNIIVYGNAISETLIRPDGNTSDASFVDSETFLLIKETDVVPGIWTLRTEGIPGDCIQVNMVYNTNLSVDVTASTNEDYINPADPITVSARLCADSVVANRAEQYTGYDAELIVSNAYQDELEAYPMSVNGDHFEITRNFDEGVYFYYVRVTGNYLEKNSETFGPITFTASEPSEKEKNNTPPYPVQDPAEYTVNIWPFFGAKLDIDMTTLAVDDQDSALRYKLESSAFIEGQDYTIDGDVIKMTHYSLKKGGFTVSAMDSMGLSCEIEVVVTTHNIGLIALIAIGIVALVVLAVAGVVAYKNWIAPFMGEITVENVPERETDTKQKSRGQLKLGAFMVGATGFGRDCYFQASGKNYVTFVSKKPVYTAYEGPVKRVKIMSSSDTEIYPSIEARDHTGDSEAQIVVRFASLLDNLF